jgi:hypothetical protein
LRFALPLVALAGCTQLTDLTTMEHPGYIARAIYPAPPPVETVAGGRSGTLIGGPYALDVPDGAVDGVIGAGLKDWLTFEERRSLAAASEQAAIAVTGAPVPWQAQGGAHDGTASGSAVAIDDVYRSLRGRICRDVNQSVDKDGKSHAETVTLCRDVIASGVAVWMVAEAD